MTTLQKKIEVMQAFADGKQVEFRRSGGNEEWDIGDRVCWDWSTFEYRVKREPREWWVNVYHGLDCIAHMTKAQADKDAATHRIECVHVREVID
jgi:hypothetical protein